MGLSKQYLSMERVELDRIRRALDDADRKVVITSNAMTDACKAVHTALRRNALALAEFDRAESDLECGHTDRVGGPCILPRGHEGPHGDAGAHVPEGGGL